MSIETIQADITAAKQIRSELLADLGDAYDPAAMEEIQTQQQRIGALNESLVREQARVDAAAAAAAAQASPPSESATLFLLAGGKRDKTLQVPAGSRLGDVLDEIGWDVNNYTLKRRLGVGQSAELHEGVNYILTEGTHEISMVPAVEAG